MELSGEPDIIIQEQVVVQHFCFRYVFWNNDLFTTDNKRKGLSEIATEDDMGKLLMKYIANSAVRPEQYFKLPEDSLITDFTLQEVLYRHILESTANIELLRNQKFFELPKQANDEELQMFKEGGELHSLVPTKESIVSHFTRKLYEYLLKQLDVWKAEDNEEDGESLECEAEDWIEVAVKIFRS
ncbi:hypothetical protein K491DRAFT_743562 [Lophiostoma macrostomum CBS 122681]|uniref:Uncharacterized protein n=1 Tax=Lophiostoma macrostomum CBS 122681 TaxID=1314788 RepID=A0A6A6TEE1_9PLEO|nr:hypothetical protein K491DRAFT_743562 [Lophiostoma macrostomum CBS 122681]